MIPPTPQDVLFVLIGLPLMATGLFLLWRIPRCKEHDDQLALPPCAIIIPARDEAGNIGGLLESINGQMSPADRVIVVDDHSVDATVDVARRYQGVHVVQVRDKPEGWTGKTWACSVGAQASRCDTLLFLDADTRLEPGGLRRIRCEHVRHGGLVTVQPYHRTLRLYEKLSAIFNIMIVSGVNAFTLVGSRLAPSGGFGPCMICSRNDYLSIGGHATVKGMVLENLALGGEFQKQGLAVHCFGGRGSLYFRMYPKGFRELIDGWTKGFATGASRTKPWILIMTIAWVSGGFTAWGSVLQAFNGGISPFGPLLYALFSLQFYWMSRRIGNFGILCALLFPLHLLFFVVVFARSWVRIFVLKSVRWRGRMVSVGNKR